MISSTSFKYARALADVALEAGTAQAAAKDLVLFDATLRDSIELREAFANPAFPLQVKQNVVRKVADRLKLSPIVVNLLLLLTERSRMGQFGEVAEAFRQIMDEAAGIVQVSVTSAVELPVKTRNRLVEKLTAVTGKEIRPQYEVDSELIGGLRLRIGSTVYDGSIRTELDQLRQELS